MRRLLYLGYYLKNLDLARFWLFFNHVRRTFGLPTLSLLADVVVSSLKYNISFLEYFQFRFFSSSEAVRRSWAGTGFMYEYQLAMNPRSKRRVLEDKTEFLKRYAPLIYRRTGDIVSLRNDMVLRSDLLDNPSGKLVLKHSRGQCGWQVCIFATDFFEGRDLVRYMEDHGFNLAEEFVVQHPDLAALSPSGVNTIRIITQLTPKDDVEFLGARLRISVDSPVDNLASGNIAAPVDLETGVVEGPAVYSDITKDDAYVHPVTGVPIVGFMVPGWPEVKNMAKAAAFLAPENRSVGWDIAMTQRGPELIEGNHDWCKLVWQLPVHRGLKAELEGHLLAYSANIGRLQ